MKSINELLKELRPFAFKTPDDINDFYDIGRIIRYEIFEQLNLPPTAYNEDSLDYAAIGKMPFDLFFEEADKFPDNDTEDALLSRIKEMVENDRYKGQCSYCDLLGFVKHDYNSLQIKRYERGEIQYKDLKTCLSNNVDTLSTCGEIKNLHQDGKSAEELLDEFEKMIG
jgi:hypothetical protein